MNKKMLLAGILLAIGGLVSHYVFATQCIECGFNWKSFIEFIVIAIGFILIILAVIIRK